VVDDGDVDAGRREASGAVALRHPARATRTSAAAVTRVVVRTIDAALPLNERRETSC